MGFKNNINVSSRLRKLAISYGIIWAVLVLSFWPFYNNSQMAMLHVIVVQYVALPIIIFVFAFCGAQRQLVRWPAAAKRR